MQFGDRDSGVDSEIERAEQFATARANGGSPAQNVSVGQADAVITLM